ncbi:MAG: HAD family phosphatase [Bacteroidetes bacterium]|nr:HAD family phosphatase [Bacteroidota bacterium]MBS1540236.1 HAD family phosphatase [Bacteroidota bacterium]
MPFAFIFDMDGVIVDTNPYHKIALKQFAEKYGYPLDEEGLIKKIYGRTNKEWIPHLFGRTITTAELSYFGEEKEAMFRELYEKDIVEVKGLTSFLEEATRLNIKMAIGTSAPRSNVDFVLKHTGIEKFFSAILDESHVTHGKPDPEIYTKCAASLKLPPAQCVVFEDSLSGIAAAKAAGCHVVGITTTHTAQELEVSIKMKDFTQQTPSWLVDQFKYHP